MNIYFAGSIRGGRQDAELYAQIITHLQKYGTVLTEHIGSDFLKPHGETDKTDKFIHDRDMEWLNASDVIVAEVTSTSLGVGYELGYAIGEGKSVLCLYRPSEGKRLSAMIAGCDEIVNKEYTELEEACVIIDKFFAQM